MHKRKQKVILMLAWEIRGKFLYTMNVIFVSSHVQQLMVWRPIKHDIQAQTKDRTGRRRGGVILRKKLVKS